MEEVCLMALLLKVVLVEVECALRSNLLLRLLLEVVEVEPLLLWLLSHCLLLLNLLLLLSLML